MSLIADQDILEVINAINKDLRHDKSFRALLYKTDGEAQHRGAQKYIEWICELLESERPPDEPASK